MVDLFFNYFDKGSQEAILKISMEMQQSLIFILFYSKSMHSSLL